MKPKLKSFLFLLAASAAFNLYSQPKTVGLLKHLNGGQENGYVLFSPLGSDTIYMINKCGKKVHYWTCEYPAGFSFYLMPNGHLMKSGVYSDTTFGPAGGRGGIIEELDWDGTVLWRYKIFNDSFCQHHDIRPLPNGNILVLAWHSISKQRAVALGRDTLNFAKTQTDLWGERIIELKPLGKDSAAIVWEWDLFDHIIQDLDPLKPNFGMVSQRPELVNINYALNLKTNDWIHANGIDYNAGLDQIVISCHNMSEIWIIDHSTTTIEAMGHFGGNSGRGGDLMYRWGNPEAYKKGVSTDRLLFRQHHAQWIPNGMKDSGCLMVFNNGQGRDTSYSSVDVIKTPVLSNGSYFYANPFGPSSAFWIYKDSVPKNFYSAIISGAQRLPNGNTLICGGVQGRLFEVTQQKKIVWEYRNPAAMNAIQTDGQAVKNNSVFRCIFYPATYPGFKNRNLSPGKTIERNSFAYSCNYETVAPDIVSVTPAKKTVEIDIRSPLTIGFNESVLKRLGNIRVFQNNVLHETIAISSDSVRINNGLLTIGRKNPFKYNSRVSVILPAGFVRDSSYNISKALDSSEWFFFTPKVELNISSVMPGHQAFNVPPGSFLEVRFQDSVVKSAAGKIYIYQNAVLKETISVSQSGVTVSGKLVRIQPSTPFVPGSDIVVEMDTCFRNSKGVCNRPILHGDWLFRIDMVPAVTAALPVHRSKDVNVKTGLRVTFTEKVTQGKPGFIRLYENGALKKSVSMTDTSVHINGNVVDISNSGGFAYGARIAVTMDPEIFKDTGGLHSAGIDSSQWFFHTVKTIGIAGENISPVQISIYPNPSSGKFYFSLTHGMGVPELRVVDVTGRIIQVNGGMINDLVELNLTGQPSGVYLLEWLMDGVSYRFTLLKTDI